MFIALSFLVSVGFDFLEYGQKLLTDGLMEN